MKKCPCGIGPDNHAHNGKDRKLIKGDRILVEFIVDGLGSGSTLDPMSAEGDRADFFLARPKQQGGSQFYGWVDKRKIIDGIVRM